MGEYVKSVVARAVSLDRTGPVTATFAENCRDEPHRRPGRRQFTLAECGDRGFDHGDGAQQRFGQRNIDVVGMPHLVDPHGLPRCAPPSTGTGCWPVPMSAETDPPLDIHRHNSATTGRAPRQVPMPGSPPAAPGRTGGVPVGHRSNRPPVPMATTTPLRVESTEHRRRRSARRPPQQSHNNDPACG